MGEYILWCTCFILKVLLHCAILSAILLAMVENLALQVAVVWCWGPVTLCNFLINLSRNAPRNEKQEVCACVFVKTAVKLRDKLLEGWYTVQWCCQLLQSVAKSRAEFYFGIRTTLRATKELRDSPCYTMQFSSNLSPNASVQCNRAFNTQTFCTSLYVMAIVSAEQPWKEDNGLVPTLVIGTSSLVPSHPPSIRSVGLVAKLLNSKVVPRPPRGIDRAEPLD